MSRSQEFHLAKDGQQIHITHGVFYPDANDVADLSSPEHLGGPGAEMKTLVAHNSDGDELGMMRLYPTGHVADVEVDPEHQRKGVATALWREARRAGYGPKHSGDFTPDGQAWAKAVGD